MNKSTFFFLSISFFLFTCSIFQPTKKKSKILQAGNLIACGDDKAVVLEPNSGKDSRAIIWSWSVKESIGQIPEEYQKLLVPLDECKPIDNNSKLLLTSSGGATSILDVKNKKVEFYSKTPMAHSAEVLPNGFLAVANSTHPNGNSLELYHRSKPEDLIMRDTLYSGHGVVWNSKYKKLFVLGYDELRTYKMTEKEGEAGLIIENKFDLPSVGGHDLSLVDSNKLLLTTNEDVFMFDFTNQSFSPFNKLKGIKNVKSVNYNPSTEHLVYTKAEESWWTYNIYSVNPTYTINLPSIKLYKVRVVDEL